jgi:hypothetical protein
VFFIVNRANPTVHEELRKWLVSANINLTRLQSNDVELERRLKINARVVFLIQETALLQPEDFRGVRDDLENLQAGTIITAIDDYLYLDYIATAPWNLITTLPKYTRGAATSLIYWLVRESFDRGYNGQIIIDVAGSAGFYRKLGFVETGEGSINAPEMVLTSAAAKKLMEEYV